MPQFILNIPKQLNEFWNDLDKAKRIKLIVLFCLLLILVIVTAVLLNRKEYVVLYSDLNPADAGEIMEKLREMNIDAKPVGSDTILILKDQEPGVRMQLASQGYPKSGFNYDLFMNSIGFGTTDYEKRKYLQFQLQDRLQEAIKTLNGVSNAIVTISIPEEDSFVFQGDKQPTTASVILELEKGYEITSQQVKAIEELVSKSILGLKPEDISIIDSNMNLLNSRIEDDSDLAKSQLDLENQVRERLQRQVLSLLEPVFGYKKVLAAVNVRLNFDKQITETVRFEPVVDDKGIVVSMTELSERVKNAENVGGVPGQDSNGDIPVYQAVEGENSDYEKISRTVNYEIDQIKEQLEGARGKIEDLSVSVVIDSASMHPDLKERVRDIVASAVGIDTDRVVVENMSFESSHSLQDQISKALERKEGFVTAELIKELVPYGLIALFAIIVFFLLYRLVVGTIRAKQMETAASMLEAAASNAPDQEAKSLESKQTNAQKEIEKLVTERPDEVAQLLRTWLSEE